MGDCKKCSAKSDVKKLQKELKSLKEEMKTLKEDNARMTMMIHNGLGWEDMKDENIYPAEL